MINCGLWWPAKNPPYKHGFAAYGMADIIGVAYNGSWHKISHGRNLMSGCNNV